MLSRWLWFAIALLICNGSGTHSNAQQDVPQRDLLTAGPGSAQDWQPQLRVGQLTDTPPLDWHTLPQELGPRLPAPTPPVVHLDPELLPAGYQEPQPTQDPQAPAETAPPATDPAQEAPPDRLAELQRQVTAQKKLIQDNQALDETSKTRALEQLTLAEEWLLKAGRLRAQIQTETAAKASFPRRLKELQDRKDQPAKPADPDTSKTLETLQGELQARQQQLQKLQESQRTNRDRLAQVAKRSPELPGLRNAVNDTLKGVESELAELSEQPEEIPNTVRRLELLSEQFALEREIEALALEAERQGQLEQTLPLERDVLARDVRNLEAEIKSWQQAANQRRDLDIQEQQRKAAAAARTAVIQNNPVLARLAARNQELAQQRSMMTSQIDALRAELETATQVNQKVELSRSDLEQKIAAIGLTSTTGMLLIEHRRSLPPVAQSQERLSELSTKLRENQSLALSLKDERQQIADEEEYVESLLAESGGNEDKIRPLLTDLVQTQVQYIDNLIGDYGTYRDELSQVVVRYRQLITNIEESKAYVDRTALWVRSAKPLASADLKDARLGINNLSQPEPWLEILGGLGSRLMSQPHEPGILALVLIGLFIVQRRLR